MLKSENSL